MEVVKGSGRKVTNFSLSKVQPEPPSSSLIEPDSTIKDRPKDRTLPMSPGWYPIKILDCISAVFAATSLVIAYCESELFYAEPRNQVKLPTEYLRDAVMLLTFGIFACVVFRWRFYQQLLLADRKQGYLYTPSGLFSLLAELLAYGVFPFPQVNSSFSGDMLHGTYTYSWDAVLLVFMVARVYLIMRTYGHFSQWLSRKSRLMGRLLGLELGLPFVFQAEFKRCPLRIIAVITTLAMVFLAIPVNVFERSYSGLTQCAVSLRYQSNAMWSMIITMTTVGYGDTYPSTHLGRVVATAGCLLGMLLTSLMVLSLTLKSTLTPQELKAYTRIKRGPTQHVIRSHASNTIKEVLQFTLIQQQTDLPSGQRIALSFMRVLKIKRSMRKLMEHKTRLYNTTPEEILHDMGNKVSAELKNIKAELGVCSEVRPRFDAFFTRVNTFNQRLYELSETQHQANMLLLSLHNSVARKQLVVSTRN